MLRCLNSLYNRLPAFEETQSSPDSWKRIGLSLLPVIGTVMYVYNLKREFAKFDTLQDSVEGEITNGSLAEIKFKNGLHRYSLYAAFGSLTLIALAVTAASVGIFSMAAACAVGSFGLLTLFTITCLSCCPEKTREFLNPGSNNLRLSAKSHSQTFSSVFQ